MKVKVKDSRSEVEKELDRSVRRARKKIGDFDLIMSDLNNFSGLNNNNQTKTISRTIELLNAFHLILEQNK